MKSKIYNEKKILQIITGLIGKNGGPIKSAITLHNVYLHDQNVEFLTIGPNDESLIGSLNAGTIQQVSSIHNNCYGLSLKLLKIRNSIRSSRIVIHHGFYLASLLYCLLFARPNTKIVIIAHGSFQEFSWGKRRFQKLLFCRLIKFLFMRNLDICFAAMTNSEILDIRKFFPTANVFVTGLGFDLNVSKKLSEQLLKPRILCLSRITQKKRIDLCIEALPLVKQNYPDVQLVIAGSGDSKLTEYLHKLTFNLGLENHVTFAGQVSDKMEFEQLFTDSALLLLPSEDENFALTVAESVIRGLPVVVSKNVGLADVVINFRFGIVTKTLSVDEIAHSIISVLENWNTFNRNCIKNLNYFSHDRIQQNWNSLLGLS